MTQLKIEFLDFWHAGTGIGKGALVDALVEKDSKGLPYLPGKTIKGILREAIRGAVEFKWIDEDSENQLFGTRSTAQTSKETETNLSRHETKAGLIQISDATIEPGVYEWFVANQDKIPHLFKNIYQTSIKHTEDTETNFGWGTAVDGSLRGLEVTVPMTLFAEIDVVDSKEQSRVIDAINKSLSLVTAMGAGRSRGLGRVNVALLGEGERV